MSSKWISWNHNDVKNYTWYNELLRCINSLPNYKFSDYSKLKAVADDNLNVVQIMISVYKRVENIVGKGETADYQHFFSLFQ